MLLQEINPFLRCAVRFRYACVSSVRCPADARILYVISGCGRLSVEGNDYPLEPGTLALIGAGFVYRLELDSPLELIALNFDYTCDRRELELALPALPPETAGEIRKDSFEDCPALSEPLTLQKMFPLREALETIISAFQTQRHYYREEVSCLLKAVLIRLARSALLTKTESDAMADRLIRYLQDHYNEEIKTEQVAARFNYHACHINRIMRRATGTTLHNYLIRYRIGVAKTLLISSELTVSEIAAETGFQNAPHFSNTFRKVTGCRPGEYRATRQKCI